MDSHAFQTRLDSLFLRGFRRAFLLIAVFFAGLMVFRLLYVGHPHRGALLTEATGSAAAFATLAALAGRVRPVSRNAVGLALGGILAAVLNALALHLILKDPWQTTNFMVVGVACGLIFRRLGPFLAAQALVIGGWGLAVTVHTPPAMLHWLLGMASACTLGVAAHLFLKRLLEELERLNAHDHGVVQDLQDALENVKTLTGLIPICAQCKKVRDDQGYWQHVEHYVATHTEADFTHGLCPACVAQARRDFGLPAPEDQRSQETS